MKTKDIFALIVAILFFSNTFAQDTTSLKKRSWYIPDYGKIQFAGNIGFFSLGIGYQFFNNHLYSELLYGYVPVSISKAKQIHTITIKNTFPVFTKQFNTIALSPITGFAASVETGNNSFVKLPDEYPEDYYCTNAFHFTLFIGAKVYMDFINEKIIKGADIYIEIGTVDAYLYYAIISEEVKISQILSTAIGVNLYF